MATTYWSPRQYSAEVNSTHAPERPSAGTTWKRTLRTCTSKLSSDGQVQLAPVDIARLWRALVCRTGTQEER
jgi:hypothetical protein